MYYDDDVVDDDDDDDYYYYHSSARRIYAMSLNSMHRVRTQAMQLNFEKKTLTFTEMNIKH